MPLPRIVIPALLALALIGGGISAASAQPAPPPEPEDLDGLERAYGRTFSVDWTASNVTATPGATSPGGWFLVTTAIFAFGSEAQASAGRDTLLAGFESSAFGGGDGRMEDVDLSVPVDHDARRDVVEDFSIAPVRATVLLAVAQDGATVAFVLAITYDDDPSPVVASALTAMTTGGPSDEAEVFNADGTSGGGLWARLPSVEWMRTEMPAFSDVRDRILYLVPASPASTPTR